MVLLCNDISHWLGASLKSAQLALDHLLPRRWQYWKIISSHTARCDGRGSCMYQTIACLNTDIKILLSATTVHCVMHGDLVCTRRSAASLLTTSQDYQQSHCTVWWTLILYVPDHLLPQHWQHQKIISNHAALWDVRGSCMYQTICCLNIDDIKRLSTVTLHCVMDGDFVCTRRSAASTLTTSKYYQQSRCTVWCTGILYVPDHLLPQHWHHQKIINSHTTLCDVRGSCMYQTIYSPTLTTKIF